MSKFIACLEADTSFTAEEIKINFLLEDLHSLNPVEEGFGDKIKKAKDAILNKIEELLEKLGNFIDMVFDKITEIKNFITKKLFGKSFDIKVNNLSLNFDQREFDNQMRDVFIYMDQFDKAITEDDAKSIYKVYIDRFKYYGYTVGYKKEEWVSVSEIKKWLDRLENAMKKVDEHRDKITRMHKVAKRFYATARYIEKIDGVGETESNVPTPESILVYINFLNHVSSHLAEDLTKITTTLKKENIIKKDE